MQAWFALVFLLLYNYGRSVTHARAVAVLESRQYQSAVPVAAVAMPDAVNPLLWRGVVETGDFFAIEDVDLGGEFDPTRASIFHKPEPDPVLDAARATPVFQEFLRFSSCRSGGYRLSRNPRAHGGWRSWICGSAAPRVADFRRERW